MISNYKYTSPFKMLISFNKLLESLEEIAVSYIDYCANYAKALLNQIKDQPEFVNGIKDLNFWIKTRILLNICWQIYFQPRYSNMK